MGNKSHLIIIILLIVSFSYVVQLQTSSLQKNKYNKVHFPVEGEVNFGWQCTGNGRKSCLRWQVSIEQTLTAPRRNLRVFIWTRIFLCASMGSMEFELGDGSCHKFFSGVQSHVCYMKNVLHLYLVVMVHIVHLYPSPMMGIRQQFLELTFSERCTRKVKVRS